MEKDPHEAVLSKLTSNLHVLEQELTKMANRLGSLNQQVNDEQLQTKRLKEEHLSLQNRLETRDKQLIQEGKDKRILVAKIAKIDKENAKMKKILSDMNLNILLPSSEILPPRRRSSSGGEGQNEETNDSFPRKDSLTEQITKNTENVFK